MLFSHLIGVQSGIIGATTVIRSNQGNERSSEGAFSAKSSGALFITKLVNKIYKMTYFMRENVTKCHLMKSHSHSVERVLTEKQAGDKWAFIRERNYLGLTSPQIW